MSEFPGKAPAGASSSSASDAAMASAAKVWDPFLCMSNRHPSKECLQRIRLDMKGLAKDPLPGIYCAPDETYNTYVLHDVKSFALCQLLVT